ncbi:hypothetical protein [Corallococcus sicarius]|uniref:hypothetical protein n=1 Tax=Corallococcus sicarius TaxID=2316726 RepID=UPI0011C45B16|nr:hypothetical protein [Corallococcus sicarius]
MVVHEPRTPELLPCPDLHRLAEAQPVVLRDGDEQFVPILGKALLPRDDEASVDVEGVRALRAGINEGER